MQSLRNEFSGHLDLFDDAAQFEESLISVQNFLLAVVREILIVRGLNEAVTFLLAICCPAVRLNVEESVIVREAHSFTGLLLELRRITAAECSPMDRSIQEFLANY